PGSTTFIADYSGIAATNAEVIPIWTDIRSGSNQNAYVAVGQYPPGEGTPTPTFTPNVTPTPTQAPNDTPTTQPSVTATSTTTSTPTSTPCTLTFSDVHPNDYFYTAVTYLACHGVISG